MNLILVRNMSFLCSIQERLFQSACIVSRKPLMLSTYSRYSEITSPSHFLKAREKEEA